MKVHARHLLAAVAVLVASGHHPASGKAPARRYMAAGGVITDLMTGLAWQQLVAAQGYSFEDAKTHCLNLNLKGTGWRVPTIKELQTIVDPLSNPAIDPVFLATTDPGYTPDMATAFYWSSTKAFGDDMAAWNVYFRYGTPNTYGRTLTFYVRCVR